MQSLVAVKRILPHLAEDEGFVVAVPARGADLVAARGIARSRACSRSVASAAAWFLAMELVRRRIAGALLRAERSAGRRRSAAGRMGRRRDRVRVAPRAQADRGRHGPARDSSRRQPAKSAAGFDGAAKLIDFGVARCAQLSDATRTGTVRGKLAYGSPEQLGARPLDGRSDLFSLAVVLHEWLAGAPLFACDIDAATVQAVQAAEIPPLPRAPRLGAVLARALARDPAQRFADGEALASLARRRGGRPTAPERLVGAHLRALFPDREGRWQAIVAGRTQVGVARRGLSPPLDGERGTGDAAGENRTVASASAFGARGSSEGEGEAEGLMAQAKAKAKGCLRARRRPPLAARWPGGVGDVRWRCRWPPPWASQA